DGHSSAPSSGCRVSAADWQPGNTDPPVCGESPWAGHDVSARSGRSGNRRVLGFVDTVLKHPNGRMVISDRRRPRRVTRLEYVDDGERGGRECDGPGPDRIRGPTLPDAGLGRGGRGPGPGDLPAGVAFVRRLRGSFVD